MKAMSCQKSQTRIQDSELIRKISSTVASCEIILVRSMTVFSLNLVSCIVQYPTEMQTLL